MGETGLEPARVLPHNDLNVARIPIPPLALTDKLKHYTNKLVPKVGLEPTLSYENSLLKTASLPIPPLRREFNSLLAYFSKKIDIY